MKQYLKKIENLVIQYGIDDIDFEDELNVVMDEVIIFLAENHIEIECIEPILKLMERYPCVSFGSPGALGHYIESFYGKGYEEYLQDSIKRAPTVHTLLLLNRLINGGTEEEKECYINLMSITCSSKDIPQEVRSTAKSFLEYQKARRQ